MQDNYQLLNFVELDRISGKPRHVVRQTPRRWRPSKLVTTLQAGERVVFETAGGGGYDDPAGRDPALVRADLADGKVSEEGAKAYGRKAAGGTEEQPSSGSVPGI